MERAVRTAEMLNALTRLPVTIDENLREWRVGRYTGKSDHVEGLKLSDWSTDPPGGETRVEMQARVEKALSQGGNAERDPLYVAHGGLWRAVRRIYNLPTIELANCALMEISRPDATQPWRHKVISP